MKLFIPGEHLLELFDFQRQYGTRLQSGSPAVEENQLPSGCIIQNSGVEYCIGQISDRLFRYTSIQDQQPVVESHFFCIIPGDGMEFFSRGQGDLVCGKKRDLMREKRTAGILGNSDVFAGKIRFTAVIYGVFRFVIMGRIEYFASAVDNLPRFPVFQ